MKFYFCEGCGKRITDEEIQSGAGRDKKLKGVFCPTCAVGVTTMDTIPMGKEGAAELLKKEAETATPGGQRRISSNRLKSAKPANRPSDRFRRRTDRHEPVSPGQSGRFTLWIAAGSGIGLLAVLVVGILFSESAQDNSSKAEATVRPGPPPVAKKVAEHATETPEVEQGGPAAVVPEATAGANADFEPKGGRASPGELEGELSGKKVDPVDEGPVAAKTPETTAERKSDAPKGEDSGKALTEPAKTSETVKEPEKPAPKPVVDQRARLEALDRHTLALGEALTGGDVEGAVVVAEAVGNDKALMDAKKLSEAVTEVLNRVKKTTAVRREGLKKLLGKSVRMILPRGKRPQNVLIKSIDGDDLKVGISFVINNPTRYRDRTIPLKEFSERAWEMLVPASKRADADAWVASALVAFARKDRNGLEEALAKCEDHVLHPLLERARSKLVLGERELAARDAIVRIERLVKAERFEEAASAMVAFLKGYGETETRRTQQSLLQQFAKELETRARRLLTEMKPVRRSPDRYCAEMKIPWRGYQTMKSRNHCVAMGYFNRKDHFVSYSLKGAFRKLRFSTAMTPYGYFAPLTYIVYGDGKELWSRKEIKDMSPAGPFDVDVTGVDVVKLYAMANGRVSHVQNAVWIDPHVLVFPVPAELPRLLKPTPQPVSLESGSLESGVATTYYHSQHFKKIFSRRVSPYPWAHELELDVPSRFGMTTQTRGIRWEGYLRVKDAGTYAFKVDAHYACRLRLNKKWLVGGARGFENGYGGGGKVYDRKRFTSSAISLEPGYHRFRLELRMKRPKYRMRLLWKRDEGGEMRPVPPECFYHEPPEREGGPPPSKK